jgi:hypothetical protein
MPQPTSRDLNSIPREKGEERASVRLFLQFPNVDEFPPESGGKLLHNILSTPIYLRSRNGALLFEGGPRCMIDEREAKFSSSLLDQLYSF